MNIELHHRLSGQKLKKWLSLLEQAGLVQTEEPDVIALVFEGDQLIATGARQENVLKLIAVAADRQGEDLTSRVITALKSEALEQGYRHLFIYTKPQNKWMFSSLFFYPVAQTKSVLLMEDRRDGISTYLKSIPKPGAVGKVGAIIMNANPFTLGHQYLVESAARQCDYVYVFVLSEDKSEFSALDRLNMVRLGTAHLSNVTVTETGPYMISAATFPTYFLKDRDNACEVQCGLDIEIFSKIIAKELSITHRFVGSEPLSAMTDKYNRSLAKHLPENGIAYVEIERKTADQTPISASLVRKLIKSKDAGSLGAFLPESTLNYLKNKDII
ncbi:MAG: [citrate (pro-3S)-lyase] ligase [Ruminococcaceae bacterium]|nr:[citrate (pro-3S)-lyase] ligase [Oscillospiraceae bacterium]